MASEYLDHATIAARCSDIDTNPGNMLMPIKGYEKMPLVSLEEAVKPLVRLVRDVRQTAQILKQRCENPSDNLSPDESAAIMLYTTEWEPNSDSLYFILNSTLRTEDRKKLKPWFLYLKLILTALGRLPSIGSRTVYRGIRLNMEHLYPKGKKFVWWAFSSCTTTIDILEQEQFFGKTGTRTLFHIECNSGRNINRHSWNEKENEVLLLPAIQLEVVACLHQTIDCIMIQLKEVGPSLNLPGPEPDDLIPVDISRAIKPQKKFSFFRSMPMISSRKSKTYQNLKLEKIIADIEPRSLINLDRQYLTDQDILIIVQQAVVNKQCTTLHLSDNRITSEGVSILTEGLHNNTTLEQLSIFNNRVDDKGVDSLARVLAENNSTLKILNLGWNPITDDGVGYLAEMLKTNRTLSTLFLARTQISDRGVKLLANALIQHNTSLKMLSLDVNNLGTDSSVSCLIDMINRNKSLQTLHVRGCKLSQMSKARLREMGESKQNFELNL
jgi:hypothetical protein